MTSLAFLRLMRWHRPIGAILLFGPAAWGLALAHASWPWYIVFAIGAWFVRSFGCVINDICDKDIDAHVPRTAKRPLACGDLSQTQALIAAIFCLFISFLIWLCLPWPARYYALAAVVMGCLYPLSKRFFYAPQLILGMTFNMSAFIAYACIKETLSFDIWVVWVSGVFLTIAYDTVYAFPDSHFDRKLNLFSTAHIAQQHPYTFVGALLLAHIAILALVIPIYWCLVYAVVVFITVTSWSPNKPHSADVFFHANVLLLSLVWLMLVKY